MRPRAALALLLALAPLAPLDAAAKGSLGQGPAAERIALERVAVRGFPEPHTRGAKGVEVPPKIAALLGRRANLNTVDPGTVLPDALGGEQGFVRFAQDDDFDPGSRVRPAHRTIDGLVLLEGGGLRAPLPTAPGRDAYLARVAALSTPGPGAPNVFLPALFGLINVVDLGAGAELSGAAGTFDPDGPSLVQRTTFARTLDLLIQTPATNRAIVGFFLDDDFSANPAFRASLGLSDDGPNVYNLVLDAYVPRDPGRTRTWKDIDDDPSLPVCGPANDPALSPGCAILDNGPRDSSALGDESLLAVTQNANVVLCIGGSNGLAPSEASFADYLGSIATPAARQRIEILEGYAHRDVLTAAQNEAVPLLADGIAGLSRRR